MSVNKAILLGNVCADPKVSTFDNGGKIAQVRIATNKPKFTKQDGTEVPERAEFHNVVIRGKLAEVAEKYIKKGDKIYVEGELHTREYEADGQKRYVTEVYVTNLEMLTPRQKQEGAPVHTLGVNDPFPW